MQDLHIAPTQSSPRVELDAGRGLLRISGESYPENTFEFYRPIIDWIADYIAAHDQATLELELSYLNTSSIRCLLDILDRMNEAQGVGKPMTVNWYYDPRDERSLELAEEFREDLELSFNLIPREV